MAVDDLDASAFSERPVPREPSRYEGYASSACRKRAVSILTSVLGTFEHAGEQCIREVAGSRDERLARCLIANGAIERFAHHPVLRSDPDLEAWFARLAAQEPPLALWECASLKRACEQLARGARARGDALERARAQQGKCLKARLVATDGLPWSPSTHSAFPTAARERVPLLLHVGRVLEARSVQSGGGGSGGLGFADVWIAEVIPRVIGPLCAHPDYLLDIAACKAEAAVMAIIG